MAVEFLDEVDGRAGRAATAGFDFIDEPVPAAERTAQRTVPTNGIEFLNESSPAHPGEITRRFEDPNYLPTLAEFKVYDTAQRNRSVGQRAADFGSTAGKAVKGVAQTVVDFVKGAWETLKDPEKNDPLVSAFEGVARGTVRDAKLARKIMGKVLDPDKSVQEAAQQFLRDKLYEFRGGDTLRPAGTSLPAPDEKTLTKWQTEFENDVAPNVRYHQFLNERQVKRQESVPLGRTSIITGEEAAINPGVAEGTSLVASPMAVIPFGKAITPAKTLARDAAAQVLEKGGRAAEVVGETVSKVASLPEKIVGKGFEWLSGSVEAGKAAENVVKRGSVPTAVAGVAGFGVPGLTETAAAVAGGKVAGRTLQGAGEASQAAGRSVAAGPSRYGLFDRISKDATAPEWLRRAANAAKPLDGSVSLVGSAVKGATEGAAIGTVLGAAADGEEGAAAGFGSGLALGAGGGLAGRIVGGGRYNEALKDADLASWIASKSPEEVANIASLKLSRDAAVNLADVERMAKGVGSDVEFQYLTDKVFTQRFGVGKGAQTVQGDRPVVFVNTGYKGGRSMFHETLHALDALEGFAPQRQQLNRVLFDQTLPDGQVVSKGLYNAADLGEFTSQYRSRLNEAARSEFDLLTPEERTARIMSEVRSESFANLVNGYSGGASVLASRGIKRRVADALLLSEADSMLGKMRSALESVGVKFEASGDPSELFVRNGKPITNTPMVDAALRDYVRAKDNITRKLVAGDDGEAPQLVVRPQDLLSKGNTGLIDTFKDADLFAKNPDGSVKMMAGVPVLLSEREINLVQSKRVEQMIQALEKVPNLGEADSVKLKPNGAWEGRTFSEKQLAAFDALPDDVLSPSMKAKLRELNTLAQSDGQQIILDYNAALKNRKYSSGIAPTTRAVVPLTFNISKAGNFFMTTLDTTHFFRKLGQWRKSKPRAFDAWNGDVDAFLRDAFTYLDNHVNGRAGSVNLDSDAAAAVHKKNVINDFFNVPKGVGNEDANPVQISTRGDKDNLIRSRRFDRINRITPGAGDKFPVRYELQKANYLPESGMAGDDYGIPHRPNSEGPRAFDLLENDLAPRDIYDKPQYYTGDETSKAFRDSVAALRKMRGKPDAMVEVYRASPRKELNDGDWIALSKDYAKQHGMADDPRDDVPVHSFKVKAKDIRWAGDSMEEFGYFPAKPDSANFLPAGVSPVAIHKQLRAQAEFDLAQKSPGPANLNQWLASAFLDVLDKQLNQRSALTRTAQLQRVKAVADGITEPEMATAFAALLSGGQNGAKQHLERLAVMKALTK